MKRANGFTLVELLVAMVGSALLLVLLGNVTASLATRARQSSVSASISSLPRGYAAFAALIQRAVPTNGPASLRSDAQRLDFLANAPEALGIDTPVPFHIVVRNDGHGAALVAGVAGIGGELPRLGDDTLAESMRSITIDAVIITDLNHDRRLSRVAVTLVDHGGTEHVWVAAPRITTRPGCQFDLISLECRR